MSQISTFQMWVQQGAWLKDFKLMSIYLKQRDYFFVLWYRFVKNNIDYCRYSGYHCCTTSFNKAWTQVLRRFKSRSRRVGDSRWWGSLTMVPAGNKAKRLSSVNHTTKTIHHHYHHHHRREQSSLFLITWNF